MDKKETAAYKIVKDGSGVRYKFYCDLSGALGCTTGLYPNEEYLMEAWHAEGEPQFNRCQNCGRWVIDAMFNADVLECVSCAPWENEPRFCKTCGARISSAERFCPLCGGLLAYEGGRYRCE